MCYSTASYNLVVMGGEQPKSTVCSFKLPNFLLLVDGKVSPLCAKFKRDGILCFFFHQGHKIYHIFGVMILKINCIQSKGKIMFNFPDHFCPVKHYRDIKHICSDMCSFNIMPLNSSNSSCFPGTSCCVSDSPDMEA